jgi:hypothetical protein
MTKSKVSAESSTARNERFGGVLYSCIDFSFEGKERAEAKKWFKRLIAINRMFEAGRLTTPESLMCGINQINKMIAENPELRARGEANPDITIRELVSNKASPRRSIPDKAVVKRRSPTGFIR